MKLANRVLPGALVLCIAVPMATATIIDFETDMFGNPLSAGTIVSNQFAHLGIQNISAINNRSSHPDLAILFDSANPTGGDTDLFTQNLNNILIIAEDDVDNSPSDGLIDDPDDEGRGGSLNFELTGQFLSGDFIIVDTEERGGFIEFFLNNLSVGSLAIPQIADGAQQSISFNLASFDEFTVNLAGSGAVGEVNIQAIPGTHDGRDGRHGRLRACHKGTLPSILVRSQFIESQ